MIYLLKFKYKKNLKNQLSCVKFTKKKRNKILNELKNPKNFEADNSIIYTIWQNNF